MPCRWEPIEKRLNEKRPEEYYYKGKLKKHDNKDQAKRIAWRQILRWIAAQLALVSTEMVKIHEVFLPYMQTGAGETIFERLESNKFKALNFNKE